MTSVQISAATLADFPMVLEVSPRYGDLDPSRRVGRQALLRWFEDARVRAELPALRARRSGNTAHLLASVRLDVLAPLRIADDYRLGYGVAKIGSTSYGYGFGVFCGDELVATGQTTSVWAESDRPAPIPAELRQALESRRLPGATPAGRAAIDPVRLVRENYPFRVDLRTRFGDVDTNRHVNNVALAGSYLDGLAELHTDVLGYPTGGPLDGLSPSRLAVEYLDQVHFPGIYQLRVGVLELGGGEVTYACGLFDGSRCIGLADATGSVSASGADGAAVDLTTAFEPFRMRA